MTTYTLKRRDGTEQGPYAMSFLQRLAAAGSIEPDDQIRASEGGAWQSAGEIEGLLPPERLRDWTPPEKPKPQTDSAVAAVAPPADAGKASTESPRMEHDDQPSSRGKGRLIAAVVLVIVLGGMAIGIWLASTPGPGEAVPLAMEQALADARSLEQESRFLDAFDAYHRVRDLAPRADHPLVEQAEEGIARVGDRAREEQFLDLYQTVMVVIRRARAAESSLILSRQVGEAAQGVEQMEALLLEIDRGSESFDALNARMRNCRSDYSSQVRRLELLKERLGSTAISGAPLAMVDKDRGEEEHEVLEQRERERTAYLDSTAHQRAIEDADEILAREAGDHVEATELLLDMLGVVIKADATMRRNDVGGRIDSLVSATADGAETNAPLSGLHESLFGLMSIWAQVLDRDFPGVAGRVDQIGRQVGQEIRLRPNALTRSAAYARGAGLALREIAAAQGYERAVRDPALIETTDALLDPMPSQVAVANCRDMYVILLAMAESRDWRMAREIRRRTPVSEPLAGRGIEGPQTARFARAAAEAARVLVVHP